MIHRTNNRSFFVGPSSTYHRDCIPHPAHGPTSIDEIDPDDGRIVHANGGVYFVYKLSNDPNQCSNRPQIPDNEVCCTSRAKDLYGVPCKAFQITDYQVVADPVNGYHLKMTKLYDPAGNKLNGRDATWWFRKENADLGRTSTVIFSEN